MKSVGRQTVWLTIAVLAPCLALTALFLRLLDQEELLATQRTREAAANRLANIRQSLLAQLEPHRLSQTPEARIAFRGTLRDGRITMAWENRSSPEHLARLEKAVQFKDLVELTALATLPAQITDEHGVPIAAYALPHVKQPKLQLNLKESALESPHLLSPFGLRLAGIQDTAHAEAGARFQSEPHPTNGLWLAWGNPLYLVGFAQTPNPGELAFRAIPAPPGLSIDSGQLLGDPFINVRVTLPAVPPAAERTSQTLIAMFAVTLGAALLGGFLLWRDASREKALAALRTQFIASVSHELRTPLTALRIFIESMKMSPDLDSVTRDEYLDTMLHETERLSRLVNNVLEFSRIERQSKSYNLTPVLLRPLVESILASTRPMLERAGFTLKTNLANAPQTVNADRDALEQALFNLIANAIKYSGQSREIQVNVETRGPRATIEVRDFGIGIAPAEQCRIFDSFYRVHSVENKNVQGAGLGLTLVRHVMEGHGGAVTVESEPGKGSAFRLLLPL